MRIEKVKLADYDEAPYNPRIDLKPGDPDYEKLKNSIEEFTFIEPPVVNIRTHHIVSGHQRIKILKEKGITEIEAVVVDFSIEKEKAANLAMNRVRGEWHKEKLAALLEELSELPDFDVTISGFDMPEINQIFDRYGEQKDADDFDFAKTIEEIKEPITKRGDVVNLNGHRLVCGDSADPNDLKLLMGDEKAAMLFCDPPYGISYYQGDRPNMSFRPRKCRKWETIYKDDLSEEEYQKWLESVFSNMDNFLAPGAPIYVFNAHKQFFGMYGILRRLKYHVGTVIVWAKPNFSISYGNYNPQVEFCVYGWKEDNGAHKWYGPANETTLWEIKRDPTKSYQHLTQKPVEIPARAIRNSSQREDIILELFGGSGSTLIASESLERKCYCMEISPAFCDGIIRRYIAYIGKDKAPADVVRKYYKEAHHVSK